MSPGQQSVLRTPLFYHECAQVESGGLPETSRMLPRGALPVGRFRMPSQASSGIAWAAAAPVTARHDSYHFGGLNLGAKMCRTGPRR